MTRQSLSTKERSRLFALHGGVCHLCGGRIDGVREAWEIEHIVPVALIGRSAETDDNRKPAHTKCHKAKTHQDVGNIAQAKRREARHVGAKAPSRTPLPFGRGSPLKKKMDGSVVRRG
jgi:5-methylcytosine-specific restriction protein A